MERHKTAFFQVSKQNLGMRFFSIFCCRHMLPAALTATITEQGPEVMSDWDGRMCAGAIKTKVRYRAPGWMNEDVNMQTNRIQG